MSFRGPVFIFNNLVASTLWHCLYCVDPPDNLLSKIQRVIVDFFWDHFHWVPQSILFLPKEEGGQGLIHLASRGAAFQLQYIQRLLTGPPDLLWRPTAQAILSVCGNLGLTENCFLMDIPNKRLSGLSGFYKAMFTIWNMFKKDEEECGPAVLPFKGTCRFKALCGLRPSVMKTFLPYKVLNLGHVVEMCGPKLENASAHTL